MLDGGFHYRQSAEHRGGVAVAKFKITRRNGEVLEVLVDDTDLDTVLAAGTWRIISQERNAYVARSTRRPDGSRTAEYLHRFLLQPPAGIQVDHVNSNGLDNRRSNLRLATSAENNRNRRLMSSRAGRLKGATYYRRVNKWAAAICVDGRRLRLGYFDTEEGAHEAYCRAAARYFKDFARTS